MSSPATSAKITLPYPLYASDFDPQNSSFLLVGGGGGEGRSGVGNKITLLNTSKKAVLSEVVEIDLSKNEDSVTSLAFAQTTELWASVFAGINSSTAEQQKGKNEHLRSFLIDYPPRRKPDGEGEKEKETEYAGKTQALGKASLFTPSTAKTQETFQRVLRLSRKRKDNGPRLGAVATGLAPEGEIVLFKADTNRPGKDDIRGRIKLGKEEAADVDVADLEGVQGQEKGKFRIAYCTDYDIYLSDADYDKSDNGSKSQKILSTPRPDGKPAPKFRCLRFITPQILLVLQNNPNGTGSSLLLLETSGQITLRKKLHKKIKSATALSVSRLEASSLSDIDQYAIAIAGADTSITLLTLDRFISHPKGRVKFRPHTIFPSVHPTSITSISLSTFHPPTTNWNTTPPQYLKLASTSIANTCVVHTIPLSPYPTTPKPDTPAHYILTPPARSQIAQNTFSTLVALLAIAIGSLFLQAFTEIRGGTPEYLGAKSLLPQGLHDWIAKPYMFEDGYANAAKSHYSSELSSVSSAAATPIQAVESATSQAQKNLGLRDLLAQRNIGSDTFDAANTGHEIIVRHAPPSTPEEEEAAAKEGKKSSLSADLVHPAQVVNEITQGEHKAKRWEDLAEGEKKVWKKRLMEAGEWTVQEGESVLKGVLFSGLAQAAGAAAAARG